VVDGRLHANNLPWDLSPTDLAARLDVNPKNIVLLNDVVATAWSLDRLPAKDLAVLNQGCRAAQWDARGDGGGHRTG
jgi:glucokinase